MLGSIVALTVPLIAAPVVLAGATITVNTIGQEVNDDADCSLQEAIYAANYDDNIAPDTIPGTFFETGCTAGGGDDTIVLLPAGATFTMSGAINDQFNYVGPTATPIVTSTILIEGLGATIVHGGGPVPYRAFAVANTGNLYLREVEIRGFEVWGGDGAGGGGGGMGAGGAIYIHNGTLTVERSTFVQNGALGGDGSSGNIYGAGGGGGGLGGDGGLPATGAFSTGGGGGGSRGDGGDASNPESFAPTPGGGGGTITAGGSHGQPGFDCGGRGGESDVIGGADGEDGDCRGGGGGGGDSESGITVPSGYGGDGAYGGGGGGGGYATGEGGHGGFGGGGGGAPAFSGTDGGIGGDGGFGGGGGAGDGGVFASGPGSGGTFAGDADEEHGGGGAGLGGAIFGHVAHIEVINSTFVGNYANRGHYGGGDSNDGRGAGGAIFTVGGTLVVTSSTFSDNQTGEWTLTDGKPVGIGGGAIVVYDPIGDTEAYLVLRNSLIAGNGPFECYTRNDVGTSGSGGNLVTDTRPNVRRDPTCTGVVETDDPGLQPLALNKPGRTRTMVIGTTSSAVDQAIAATSPQIDQRLILRPQGGGYDIGAYEAAIIPPVTAITLDPATPDGNNSWYRSTVGVTVFASDVDGIVAQTRCVLDPSAVPSGFADLPDAACSVGSVAADGLHAVYAASIDGDGNVESPLVVAAFKLDQTPPTLTPTLNVAAPITIGQTGVVASPNATDATSGLASSSCGSVDTSSPGVQTVTCTATDNAGNVGSASLTYVVEYRILGFFAPVPWSKWMVGQTVPVKVALGDGGGNRISDSEALALASACRVTFSATGAQTKGPECVKYDILKDQFVYNWKLGRNGTGTATITVSISYPGTTVTTRLEWPITITR
ncbi:MAG TPA: choice-of-anchor Q domain-containing protein [Candidatus Sulfomarinibacteraceae bacterium]|nr:choice-of-anchor Q domain-containing protein [Candidatus Sulfomarinibacteraceae bacterium]